MYVTGTPLHRFRRLIAVVALAGFCVAQIAVACTGMLAPGARAAMAGMPCADAIDDPALCAAGCYPAQVTLDSAKPPIALAPPPIRPLVVPVSTQWAASPASRAEPPAPAASPPYLATLRLRF
jgi:hypothetical protein